MGYFSQKKKQKRIDTFLAVSLSALVLLAVLNFLNISKDLNNWIDSYRFQIHIVLILFLLFALYVKKAFVSAATALLIIINYTIISSGSNLFFPSRTYGTKEITISYHKGKTNFSEIIKTIDAASQRMGSISLSPHQRAVFINFESDNTVFTLINLDFSSMPKKEIETVFKNLSGFVKSLDNPVIIVGDFGITAWSPEFKKFMVATSLEVKNQIIMADAKYTYNLFGSPTINLLAYKNVGIKSIKYIRSDNSPLRLEFDLNYD